MKTAGIVLLFVAASFAASAQEMSLARPADSLTLRELVFPDRENPLLLPRSYAPARPLDSASIANLPPGYIRSEMLSLPTESDSPLDITSSLKLQGRTTDRYTFLRSALNYVLIGGEAYMVYEAMRKYGYIRIR